jgi:hypothetical protein
MSLFGWLGRGRRAAAAAAAQAEAELDEMLERSRRETEQLRRERPNVESLVARIRQSQIDGRAAMKGTRS